MRKNPILETETNITTRHKDAFTALTSGEFVNFALFSCFVNGAPAAAIVAVNPDGDMYHLEPLFVSVTESMILTDHEGQIPEFTKAAPAGDASPDVPGNTATLTIAGEE